MPPLRTVSRDTPKDRHFTKKQPLKGAVFCFQRRRAESRFPAAVQSRCNCSILPQSLVLQQPFSPAAVVQSAATVQSRNSRSILPQSFNPPQPFNPAATVQSRNSRSVRHSRSIPLQLFNPAAVVSPAAVVQSRNSISNRLAFPRGFVTVTNAFRPSR